MEEQYYTVNEIAARFKVTRTTVYEWMNLGKLKWIRVGGRRRVTEEAVQQFIKESTAQSAEQGTMGNETRRPSLAVASTPA